MDSQAIIELQYLPPIPYMACWAHFDEIIIESKESYSKQSYRNRCRILTANQVSNLIIPIQKGNSNIPIQEIRIDQQQGWVKDHWGAIRSAYGNAPYFEHYASDLEAILFKKHRFLFDLNLEILETLLKILGMQKNLVFSQKFEKTSPSGIQDLRSVIHPKQDKAALDFYRPPSYLQVFGNQFVEDLSVIDLLFCEGPEARHLIRRSIAKI